MQWLFYIHLLHMWSQKVVWIPTVAFRMSNTVYVHMHRVGKILTVMPLTEVQYKSKHLFSYMPYTANYRQNVGLTIMQQMVGETFAH